MAKKIILKLADVQVYSDVSDNFVAARLSRFAIRAQETALRELLGDALYNKLYSDLDASGVPATAKYTELVDGKEYTFDGDTIEYFGLKPFLVFNWLSLNVSEGDLFMAQYGNVQFSEHQQDNMVKISQKTIDRINAKYGTSIISYQNNISQFLNENQSTYPEWDGKADNKSKTGLNMFTV